MSIIAWVLLGLVSGFIASKIVDSHGRGVVVDVVLGLVGAFVGGSLFHFFGRAGVTGLNLWSLLVSVVGAVVVLGTYHLISGARGRVSRVST